MTSEEKSKKKSYAKLRSEETEKRVVVKLGEKETLKELEEKREMFEKLGRQFSVPRSSIIAFKRYQETLEEIKKQAEPMKKALEQLNATYSGSIQNSLAPVLQRLTESIKPIREQIRKWNEIYDSMKPRDNFFISRDIIRTEQEAKTISTLENIEILLQKLLSKDKQEPTPVEIVKPKEFEIKGLEKGLEAIAKMRKEDDRPKFPYRLPAGTKWEDFTVQFLDEENVFIKVRQYKHNANYGEMGLIDKRFTNPRPSVGWILLRVLAKYNGEITIKDPDAKDTYKKQKELVTKALQSYFSIEYDPFYPYEPYSPYKTEKSYKIKITLLPPPQTEKQTPPPNKEKAEKELSDEVKEFFNEQTPQV